MIFHSGILGFPLFIFCESAIGFFIYFYHEIYLKYLIGIIIFYADNNLILHTKPLPFYTHLFVFLMPQFTSFNTVYTLANYCSYITWSYGMVAVV